MSLTENNRQAVEVQVKEARRRMLQCRLGMAAIFTVFIVTSLVMSGHHGLILLLFVPVAIAIAALGNIYSTADELLSGSTETLERLDRIDRLR